MSYSRNTQKKYVAAGKCEACGKRPISKRSKTRCATCLQKGSLASVAKEERHLEAGLCAACGQPREDPARRRCEKCREVKRLHRIEQRQERIRAGLCPECGKRRLAANRLRCAECITAAARRRS